ncbi:hypothetical protein JY97_07005 [Alkalispirochaeta odontotermitis]|nr:hypothetical protein JY97_07005 [Alkalispirochaeta odontotermitis]CAB1080225.1 hypothetical protein D1AOALGA4SA_7912 [Olavius algarvensis Delta 1 endosymbiont]
MRVPQKLTGLIVLSIALLLLSNLPSAAETRKVYGYAINKDGQVAYLEEHLLTYLLSYLAKVRRSSAPTMKLSQRRTENYIQR